eukprot:g69864.t1
MSRARDVERDALDAEFLKHSESGLVFRADSSWLVASVLRSSLPVPSPRPLLLLLLLLHSPLGEMKLPLPMIYGHPCKLFPCKTMDLEEIDKNRKMKYS